MLGQPPLPRKEQTAFAQKRVCAKIKCFLWHLLLNIWRTLLYLVTQFINILWWWWWLCCKWIDPCSHDILSNWLQHGRNPGVIMVMMMRSKIQPKAGQCRAKQGRAVPSRAMQGNAGPSSLTNIKRQITRLGALSTLSSTLHASEMATRWRYHWSLLNKKGKHNSLG